MCEHEILDGSRTPAKSSAFFSHSCKGAAQISDPALTPKGAKRCEDA